MNEQTHKNGENLLLKSFIQLSVSLCLKVKSVLYNYVDGERVRVQTGGEKIWKKSITIANG